MIDPLLLARLEALARKHAQQGRVSHAAGVRSAIALIRREQAIRKASEHPNPIDGTIDGI